MATFRGNKNLIIFRKKEFVVTVGETEDSGGIFVIHRIETLFMVVNCDFQKQKRIL